jgi:hypothetical protein
MINVILEAITYGCMKHYTGDSFNFIFRLGNGHLLASSESDSILNLVENNILASRVQ